MESPAARYRYLKRNKLKKYLVVPLLSLLLACNNNAGTEETIDASPEENDQSPALPDLFPEVTAFYRQQHPGFDPSAYELAGEQTGNSFITRPFDEKEVQAFRPLLVYNADSTKAIDMYSGSYVAVTKNGQTVFESGEPDTEVAVLDFGRKERIRIFYTGPSFTVQDVRWLDDSTIAIAGAMQVGPDQVQPQYNKVYLNDGRQEVYAFRDTLNADLGNYRDRRIRKNGRAPKAGQL